jgi:hypothetical protein
MHTEAMVVFNYSGLLCKFFLSSKLLVGLLLVFGLLESFLNNRYIESYEKSGLLDGMRLLYK